MTGSWRAMKVAGLVSSDRVYNPSHALAAAGMLHHVLLDTHLTPVAPSPSYAMCRVLSAGSKRRVAIVICVLSSLSTTTFHRDRRGIEIAG